MITLYHWDLPQVCVKFTVDFLTKPHSITRYVQFISVEASRSWRLDQRNNCATL